MSSLPSIGSSPHIVDPLRHRGSTRRLIGRFESMSSSRPQTSGFAYPYSGKPLAVPLVPLQHASSIYQKKDKSPIRRSFRNLFSVFKKATTSIKNDTPEGLVSTSPALLTFKSPSSLRSTSRVFSGPLLYLLRPPNSSEGLVSLRWITCTATLEGDRITIASMTTQDSLIHTIYLSNCADVRSLAIQQLDPSETALLRQTKEFGELRVFEILFEGRAREKFAATSVRDRAGWVSAIWDATLPSQEHNNAGHEINENFGGLKDTHGGSGLSLCLESAGNVQPSLQHLDLNRMPTERLLPPIPADSEVSHLLPNLPLVVLQDQSRASSPAQSIYPPSRSASKTSLKEIYSQSTSLSVVNLGRFSGVHQHLSQIERYTNQDSTGFRPRSPTSSPQDPCTTHLIAPPPPPSQAANSYHTLDLERLQRAEHVKPSSIEILLDAHSNTRPNQPDTSTAEGPVQIHDLKITDFQKRPSHLVDSGVKSRLESFVELFQDYAAQNYDQTANLSDQLISLQDGVQRLPQELADVVLDSSNRVGIHKTIASLEAKTEANGEALRTISEKLSRIERISLKPNNTVEIHQMMQDIRQKWGKDIPVVSQKPDILQRRQEQDFDFLRTSTPLQDLTSSPHNSCLPAPSLLELHNKVDVLINLRRPNTTVEGQKSPSQRPLDTTTPELAEIRALLEDNTSQILLQGQQQAESVRYLNELNLWLETFVNNGTSQIHNILLNVERLSQYLGCGFQRSEDITNGLPGLLGGNKQSLIDIHARHPDLDTLQASVDRLFIVLSESQRSPSTAAIASLIARQHQDQEELLQTMMNKISDDIKGERLRFVEAMKEATAINVQIHVEQFKAELSREVSGMTEQVGQLHRERQAMEAQIADLFAFYTKRKEAVGPSTQLPAEHGLNGLRYIDRRPLPDPR